jgi:molybdopterin biosynthesis enzyme
MSNVISIAAVRAEKLKQALSIHSQKRETVIIEVRTGTIFAERIICRDRFAEILNSAGDYLVLDYADIRSVRSATVAQTSIVNGSGEFQPAHQFVAGTRTVPILPFEPRLHRRP